MPDDFIYTVEFYKNHVANFIFTVFIINKFLVIETKWDGTELNGLKKGSNYSVVVKFSSKEEAIKEYDKLHNMNTDLDRAVEVTKVFEKRELQKEAEKTDADKLREAVKKAAADLIAKFGAESHIK